MSMTGRKPSRGRRPQRRLTPEVERLDTRELLSHGIGHPVGPFATPNPFLLRVSHPAQFVPAHPAILKELSAVLGPGIDTIEAKLTFQTQAQQNPLEAKVASQPFVNSTFSRLDTYTLLTSPALNAVLGQGAQSLTGTYQVTVPLKQVFGTSLDVNNTVTITPNDSVNPPAFALPVTYMVTVPSTNVLVNANGTALVTVPESALFQQALGGTLGSSVYGVTGPLLVQIFRSSLPSGGPTAARDVPGLRLENALLHNSFFPDGAGFFRLLRVAADRELFTLSQDQLGAVSSGLIEFLTAVSALNQSGTFTPSVPIPAPTLVHGPLDGTFEVSLGALRELTGVDPSVSGLQLPEVGNFPGQIDVGYVFDRAGDYGLALTVRGPLSSSPPLNSANHALGDVRVQVSNAPNITALNGLRNVEGLNLGSGLAGSLDYSNSGGAVSFGAGVGYGSGLEYGTGVSYTLVIPLGNVYKVIPSP
jgi:hypothetical protein